MKKVIDGRLYNTETAEEVAYWDNGRYGHDFAAGDFFCRLRCEERLYKTKKGTWFTQGSGGPMSSYAVSVGDNTTSGSEDIRPLSPDEALAWLEERDEVDAIEEHFSDKIMEA